jgi:hypothetical protein
MDEALRAGRAGGEEAKRKTINTFYTQPTLQGINQSAMLASDRWTKPCVPAGPEAKKPKERQ